LAFGCRCGRSGRILVCSLVRTKMRPVLACTRPGLSRWHTARAGSQAFLSSSCRCLLSYTQTRVMWCTMCGGGVEGKPWSATIRTHPANARARRTHTHINQVTHACTHKHVMAMTPASTAMETHPSRCRGWCCRWSSVKEGAASSHAQPPQQEATPEPMTP
jgi:hypothetical protein